MLIKGWDDAIRRARVTQWQDAWVAHDAITGIARSMLSGHTPTDVAPLLRAYADGVSSHADPTHFGLRRIINLVGRRSGALPENEEFFDRNWSIKQHVLAEYCPDLEASDFALRPNDALEQIQLLERGPNELQDLRLQPPIGNLIRRARRAPLWLYSSDDASVYADPFRYQVLSRDGRGCWDSGSPRVLKLSSLHGRPRVDLDRNLVVLQDRFDFRNFCHFMCDAVSRLLLYADRFGIGDETLFIFGSIPSAYHQIVLGALEDLHGLTADNVLFPTDPVILGTSRRVFWFSDQKESYIHPTQMAHPRPISWLQNLAHHAGRRAGDSLRRIYISRADAQRRRIVNEPELVAALEQRGFRSVELARLDVPRQIALFRDAEMIVAPHGMGLTHLFMGTRLARIIELFNPVNGGEAYAFLAKSMGITHDFVLGEEVDRDAADFTVDVGQVLDYVGTEFAAYRQPAPMKAANLVNGSKTFGGFSAGQRVPVAPAAPRMIWDQACMEHEVRPTSNDDRGGRWRGIEVIPGERYTASCWVWLAESFDGRGVKIEVGNWATQVRHGADIGRKMDWQRIWTSVIAPPSVVYVWVELQIQARVGTIVTSTCWQFERGPQATAYVATQ